MPGFVERHKRHLVILALFLFLFWLVTLQVKAGRLTVLERPVLAVNGFIGRAVTGTYDLFLSVARGYVLLVRTERENRRLHAEVDRLRLENQITGELLAENDRLRAALDFQKASLPGSVIARVVAKEWSPASRTLILDKGSGAGLEHDRPVVTAAGVVGRIVSVTPGTSKVMMLTDPGSTIAVRVQRNREEGLLEGKVDRCALKYVSYYLDVQEGDLLVSSGLDGIYPRGLPVAVVTSVQKSEASSFQKVFARPAAPLSRIEEVLVLKQ